MAYPEYCMIPDEGQPGAEGPCPGCGATASGNDPVRGVCQARRSGYPPHPLVTLVLVDRRTGEIVAGG
jgi:hypothetical protein